MGKTLVVQLGRYDMFPGLEIDYEVEYGRAGSGLGCLSG